MCDIDFFGSYSSRAYNSNELTDPQRSYTPEKCAAMTQIYITAFLEISDKKMKTDL
jgi:hypothetical protein